VPKDFVSIGDWPRAELDALLARAAELKRLQRKGERPRSLLGRTLAMYFEHPSLRTHVTFEAGMAQLGGHAIFLTGDQVGIGRRESAPDVARNLSRWVDAIVARTARHELVESLAAEASIPVINALTDRFHPCQAMADVQAMSECGALDAAHLAFVGDGNNVANSLALAAAVLGFRFSLATPATHRPPEDVWNRALALAEASGAQLDWTEDPAEAVAGANFVYTDVWASMGQEHEAAARRKVFAPYQVNAELLRGAPEAWVMHDLPAHRGEEITDEVLDGPRSIVLEQAENRLHAQKAILERLIAPPNAQ
jgi:ornithine carbamoyltransferase